MAQPPVADNGKNTNDFCAPRAPYKLTLMYEDAAPLGVDTITTRATDTHTSFKTWRVH